ARAARAARIAQMIACQLAIITSRLKVRPISRKIKELAMNAAYSQKLKTTRRVVADIPLGPALPLMIPAAATANTPLTWKYSATRYEPKARTVVKVVSTSGS